MNRRTFVQAASVLLASFQIVKPAKRIDLQPFCGVGLRWDMTTPFEQSGKVYATDGRVAIRTELFDAALDDAERRLPPADELFDSLSRAKLWQPYPRQQWIVDPRNSPAFGRYDLCPFCCDEDGGECDYCDGDGSTDRPCLQVVGGMLIGGEYDRKIRGVNVEEFALVPMATFIRSKTPSPSNVVAFRGDGFEGLLATLIS